MREGSGPTSGEVAGSSGKFWEENRAFPENHCRTTLAASMGWGVGEELTKSWPTFEHLCVQNLALAISCCFFLLPRARTKSCWLEVDQELDMGCQLLTRTFLCSRAAKRGGFKRGVSRSGLVLPFFSFLGLSRFFRDFPILLGDGPGIFPICPFPLSQPIKSTYEEQSRKGPRQNLDLSPKKVGNPPGLETPGLASLNVLKFAGFFFLAVLWQHQGQGLSRSSGGVWLPSRGHAKLVSN